MRKLISTIIVSTLLIGGCSTVHKEAKHSSQSIPEEVPASQYKGQGFQPVAEKSAIAHAKKYREEYEKLGEIPFDKEAIHEEGSMRSNDNGDTMSNMVGTVLSGFEYKAQKEKYDNLTKFFKDNEEKYQYTGFTKEAIHKTQNVGYQNEYYYLAGNVTNINNYRKYYEPLIKKDSKNFKEGMKKANEATNFKAKIEVVSTLFSTKSDFTKNNSKKDLLFLSDDLYHYKEKPENTNITLQLSEPKINSTRAFYDANNPLEYGVHKHE
ncbi:MAG: DUF1672 family protein [Staphylococcus epidermidis]|nr:DUF1672 family protein [Staphylococcus epidermidis]